MALSEKFIGGNIRKYRRLKKLSQEELGNAIGMTGSMISCIENNRRKVQCDQLIKFSEFFGCTMEDLFR